MRNSRILAIIEIDLGPNRFENDRQNKGCSLLYIAVERPLENTPQQIYY